MTNSNQTELVKNLKFVYPSAINFSSTAGVNDASEKPKPRLAVTG